jgi:catechol 2,3-dioxygenase-like lactoylglutathione lyase family enzyme
MNKTLPAIHHVQVAMPAGREHDARAFYSDLLGFREIPKPANLVQRGGCWFETGNLQLHLGVDKNFSPATKAHVAYQVTDIEKMRARFEAAGVTIVEDEPLPGYDRFYVADPFGNRVEILQPVTPDTLPQDT